HKSLFSHLHTLSRQFGYTRDSKILNILMLAHADGIIQGPVIAFFNEASLYRPMRFEIKTLGALLDSIHTHRITHFVAVPTIISLMERLCRDRQDAFFTEDFQTVISTGAYLNARLWKTVEEHFQVRIANVYGLTETVTGGLFSGPGNNDHCIGTVGKPADCEVKIVDEQGSELRTGEPGELLMRGDHVMKGYLNAPEATARVLREGWLSTGDIATVDEEGFYRIVGRKKNIVISGGINIHPEEITEVLNLSPHVADAVTFGVPDGVWGERVVSAVSLTNPGGLSENDLISFCRVYLEETKIPDRIYVLSTLPKGPAGKVIIEKVKEVIQQVDSYRNTDLQGDLKSKVISIAAYCFRVNQFDLSIHHGPDDTTGWDSLTHLEFVAALEDHFGIIFSPSEIMQIERLSDAWKIITEKLSQGWQKRPLP
ncbi:MAG TPA: AMP-binding protein, partial [Thermodesulfovibrionales bacterium]|nr:AMP-binding protein [Thermodesulfovibrionales bacterium]